MPCEAPTRRKRGRKFPKKKYRRRVNRLFECGYIAVNRAIPAGSMRPDRAMTWLQAVFKSDHINALNAQARENVKKFALVAARSVDLTSMTIRPGWEYLIAESGLSRSTVNRIRQRLHDAGLMGTVAKGRQAEHTPQGNINERAVYVLCVPSTLKSVDKSEPPTGDYEVISPPDARADANLHDENDGAAPRLTLMASPRGSAVGCPPANRKVPEWQGSLTTKSAVTKGARLEAERQAAAMLQAKFFALRRTTTADVATRCRPFFMAGWTLNDIAHALDWMPGGGQWGHDGANGVSDVGRWMLYRLNAWRDGATVLKSRSQRAMADRERKRALQRKGLAERADRLAELGEQNKRNSVWTARVKAILRGAATMSETGEVIWSGSSRTR